MPTGSLKPKLKLRPRNKELGWVGEELKPWDQMRFLRERAAHTGI